MITGIILASGFSKRMKEDKLTMDLKGKAIIEYVIEACVGSKLDKIILVYRTERVREIGEKYRIKTVYNENASLGQAQAIKLGIGESDRTSSFMFLVGDQPFLDENLINSLISEYHRLGEKIVVPYYDGRRGMPVIFPAKYRGELLKLQGDKGGREIIEREYGNVHRLDIKDVRLGKDIDRREDLDEVTSWME